MGKKEFTVKTRSAAETRIVGGDSAAAKVKKPTKKQPSEEGSNANQA